VLPLLPKSTMVWSGPWINCLQMVVAGKEQAPFRAIRAFPVVHASVGDRAPEQICRQRRDDMVCIAYHDVVDEPAVLEARTAGSFMYLMDPELLHAVDRSDSGR